MKWAALALLLGAAGASWASCETRDGDCPACPLRAPVDSTTTLYLTDPEIVGNANASELAIEAHSGSAGADIIRMEDLGGLHTSVDYLCCHTPQEELAIARVLADLAWEPFDVTYSDFGCNLDHDNETIYLHALPDQAGQDALMGFARSVEAAMEAAGVPVNHPRQSLFHMTLARVSPDYPVDSVVELLGGSYYGVHRVCKIEFLNRWFYSSSGC